MRYAKIDWRRCAGAGAGRVYRYILLRLGFVLGTLLGTVQAQAAIRPPGLWLTLQNKLPFDRKGELVTCGVPFLKGEIPQGKGLVALQDGKRPLRIQAKILERYGDGSVRWARLDFAPEVPAGGASRILVRPGFWATRTPSPLSWQLGDRKAVVHTGPADFVIGLRPFRLFESVKIRGREFLDPSFEGSGLLLRTEGGTKYRVDLSSIEAAFEETGPLRLLLRVRGKLVPESGRTGTACFVCRYVFVAGSSAVRLFFTLRNPQKHNHPGNIWDLGQGGSLFVEDFSLVIGLKPGICEKGVVPAGRGRICSGPFKRELTLYQDSSGGRNWRSYNHVNKDYRMPVSFCGYRIYRDGKKIGEGKRIDGWAHAYGPHGGVAVAVRHFWQNFPKAVSCRKGALRVGLWPGEFADSHEILGGEQKTHELLFFFHGAEVSHQAAGRLVDAFNNPLIALPDPGHVVESGVFGPSALLDRKRFANLEATCDSAFDPRGGSSETFVSKWELIDEYGWRHFGDTFADNERAPAAMVRDFPQYHIGSTPIGHYVNEYDVISAVMLQGLRRGDPRWLSFADAMARHHADICIYHTDKDVPAYSHGPFMHTTHETAAYRSTFRSYPIEAKRYGLRYGQGGGPNAGHTYVDCLAYHYLLTGNRTSLDSFLEAAGWAAESPWFSPRMMGDGRGYGNFLRTFVLAYRLTGNRSYYEKAITVMSWVKRPFAGLAGTLFSEALGSFIQLKIDREEFDGDLKKARELLMSFGGHYLTLSPRAWQRYLEQRCFHSAVLCTAYLFAPPDHPKRKAFKERGLSIIREALDRFPGRYVPTKTWVMCFGKVGPFLKVASEGP